MIVNLQKMILQNGSNFICSLSSFVEIGSVGSPWEDLSRLYPVDQKSTAPTTALFSSVAVSPDSPMP